MISDACHAQARTGLETQMLGVCLLWSTVSEALKFLESQCGRQPSWDGDFNMSSFRDAEDSRVKMMIPTDDVNPYNVQGQEVP